MIHLGELLSVFLDGELSADEHNRVTSHLRVCASCGDDLTALHQARAVVRSLPTIEAPVWVLGLDDPAPAIQRPRLGRLAAVAAAAVLVATIGVATWLSPTPELTVDFSDIANAHRVRASQDGTPTGARLIQIAPLLPAGAE